METTRREFLRLLGAGILVAVTGVEARGQAAPGRRGGGGRGGGGPVSIAARVHIGKDGVITVMTGKVEGGQGARAEITQAAAEELHVPPEQIQLIMGDTALCPDDGGTYGSQTTPRSLPSVRNGAAGARHALLALAATKFDVAPADLKAEDGQIHHAASGRSVTYGELVGEDSSAKFATTQAASGDGNVTITAVKEWKVMGTSVMRPNARDLVVGGHAYPSDIQRPGMLYGKVLRPPSFGAKLSKIDLSVAKAMDGVVVVQEGDFVGVAAPTSLAARNAIAALEKTAAWDEQDHVSSTKLFDHLADSARGGVPANPFADRLANAAMTLKQTYHVSYVQHAPMEPRAAVAEWADGKLTVWTGTQNPFGVRGELQRDLQIAAGAVRVIVPDFGGGFGGKHSGEVAIEAARLAKAAGKPVSRRWTREEEFTWAYFRPAGVIVVEAGLTAAGEIDSWHFININSGPAALETPYRTGQNHAQVLQTDSPLRQSSYRGLAGTANHFARESFMDELAAKAGVDPLTFRLKHLDNDRMIAVLKTATERMQFSAQWAKKTLNVGIGIACGTDKGSYVAACAQVAIDPKTRVITVQKVCQAYECGKIVNPTNLLSQVQGALVMGLGPALRERMEFEKGKITNGTFSDYLVPRFADLPLMDIQLMDRPDIPSAGAGETPIMAIAPAIANAVFHATGTRVRSMPIELPA